jgi:hypothetical protein
MRDRSMKARFGSRRAVVLATVLGLVTVGFGPWAGAAAVSHASIPAPKGLP